MECIDGVILIGEEVYLSVVGTVIVLIPLITSLVLYYTVLRGRDVILQGVVLFICVGLAIVLNVQFLDKRLFCTEPEYTVVCTAECDMQLFQEVYEILDYENGKYIIKPKDSSNQQNTC